MAVLIGFVCGPDKRGNPKSKGGVFLRLRRPGEEVETIRDHAALRLDGADGFPFPGIL